MAPIRLCILIIIFLFLLPATGALAGIIFVDDSLAADCPSSYDPMTKRCGGGAYKAFRTIKGAADIAVAGDTVVLRAGVYNEQLAPRNSGTEAAPIIYASYGSEKVYITGAALSPAIWIYRTSHIIIQGIIVIDVRRWLAALGSHHITIRFSAFLNAADPGGSSKTGLFFQSSDYNVVRGNIIDNSTQDNLAFVQSHHNLVEGNRITRAAHTLWAIKCGSFNVLRGNYFHNAMQKIGEIYDCDEVGYGDDGYPKVTSLDDTRHNVVENNIFAFTSTPVDASPYAGIQHAGQHSIIRGNIFYHCIGPPIDLTLYADEARHNYRNRIYNNTFYDNKFGGVSISGLTASGFVFADNLFRNNIFYRNSFERHDTRWTWYEELDRKPVQIITGRESDVSFERNNLFDTAPDELWTIAYGSRTSQSNPAPQPLSWWEAHHPAIFSANMQSDPDFADTSKLDFHLRPGSPLIDAGLFPTRTKSAGSGTTISVEDAGYFRDGYGIPGLGGDTLQLEGESTSAAIVAIDYAANSVTLDRPLAWRSGQGISLRYVGRAPDIGALEADAGQSSVAAEPATGEVMLHPNPTSGRCTITFPAGAAFTPAIRVVSMLGEILHAEPRRPTQGGGECILDLSGYPSGIYMIQIEGDGGVMTRLCVRR